MSPVFNLIFKASDRLLQAMLAMSSWLGTQERQERQEYYFSEASKVLQQYPESIPNDLRISSEAYSNSILSDMESRLQSAFQIPNSESSFIGIRTRFGDDSGSQYRGSDPR
jgi:hypothetical protein